MTPDNYGDCIVCGGRVSPKLVEKICTRHGRLLAIVQGVPAGVCDQCGERSYKASVIKHIERILAGTRKNRKYVQVPVESYAA